MSEEFEDSIRKKLSEADYPFDQDAWKKMESLLDKDEERKPVIIWWRWAAAAILVLTAGLTWWLLQQNTTPSSYSSSSQPIIKQDTPVQQRQGAGTSQVAALQGTVHENLQHVPRGTSADSLPPHKGEVLVTGEKNKFTTPVPAERKKKETKAQEPGGITTGTAFIGIESLEKVRMKEDNYNDYTKIETAADINNVNDYTKINEQPSTIYQAAFSEKDTAAAKAAEPKRKNWYIGLTLGPDLSVAPSFKYGNIGFNAGILLHYYFNKKLFVTSGIIYSKKIYTAPPKDYDRWNGNTYPSGTLIRINADCDVIDIPLNINYTFLQAGKNRFSATAGLSNYLMLREKYRFTYKYGPQAEKNYENENQHYLSILNAGLLYQRPVSHRILLGVQPYAKIPLHGVGYGHIRLFSAGVSVQFTLTGRKP
ncbi:hypothetical protein ECE50_021555 [Chitinophaga sp. Mgbs1]|uniref:Uncharacterized protein n=1 Tax=Chitinophaga solisilvae TaxID=1233460 RepID=A0A3S1AXN2_9BACT|nr:hypothetical protein [Chitinophaga solisilvae]